MIPRDTATERSVTELAKAAIARGTQALAAQDTPTALRWLDRAHRLVPRDPNTTLILATVCLDADPARAASLLTDLTSHHDVRQAWLGLAAARLRLHGPEAAAEPLAMALSRHAFNPEALPLSRQIARTTGWCALRSDGVLEIHPASPGRVHVTLDGQPLPRHRLPPTWARNRALSVRINDRDLLGSPIRIDAIRRLAGCVEVWQNGIRGWAWHPGDPDTTPVLTLTYASKAARQTLAAIDEQATIPDIGPLARPRSFHLKRQDLLTVPGPIHLRGPDGQDLPGSPLDPFATESSYIAAARQLGRRYPACPAAKAQIADLTCPILPVDEPLPLRPVGADLRQRSVTIVIPVHNGGAVVDTCLKSVLTSRPDGVRVLVIDDGSSDPALVATLDSLARQGDIVLLRHPRPRGFPVSANAGIRAASNRDVVLLNSDTIVPPGWLPRLRQAAYAAPDIGTVTPLSNDGGILSYPNAAGPNPIPDQLTTTRLDRLAFRANRQDIVDIPVGVGFCLYLRRDCLTAVGAFRPDLFAQGYGEENDYCLRARRLGWRNVGLTGLFVGHHGGSTFGATATHLRQRNARVIEHHHPGYHALVQRYLTADPLAEPRRRIDLLAWKQAARRWPRAAILITHDEGGGVEQRLSQAAATMAAAGCRPIILRPARAANDAPAIAVHDGLADDLPNLIFAIPRELSALLALLRSARPDRIEIHHLAAYPPAIHDLIARLGLPYQVHIHDYAWFCPRISLVGTRNRYCGEPDLPDCEACIADNGHFLNESITVPDLWHRSAKFLREAQRVVAPATDVATRIRQHFPGLSTVIQPHEDDDAIQALSPHGRITPSASSRPTVCVVGAIGVHKGYEVLLACARDAARRDLDLTFVVVGHTIDDARLMATGRVFVTGRFDPGEAVGLIAAQHADLGFVPSICPETWCLSLGDLWRAGLTAASFDIGAQAERISRSGRGVLIPLGLPASAVNDALALAIRRDPAHASLRQRSNTEARP